MEITERRHDDGIELTVHGRLDSYWAEHLDTRLAHTLREGHDRLRLDLAGVTFLSSAGIGVLVKYFRRLGAMDGKLVICSPSPQVRTVLDMTRLTAMLVETQADAPVRRDGRHDGVGLERDGVRAVLFDVAAGATLQGAPVGGSDPGLPAGTTAESVTLRCPPSVFAIGVGAIGATFSECRDRFGEFLAVGGAAVYLPGDGTHVPDYLVAAGGQAPGLQVLHGLRGEGEFARLLRFECVDNGALGLSALARWCLELSGGDTAGLAVVAEAAGLVGAALQRSPAIADGSPDMFAYPAVREHLSFTADRAFARATTVAVGFVASEPSPQLRPLDGDAGVFGHFHAAAFSFAPLKKGRLALDPLLADVFEQQALLGVLHLLNDDRVGGAGQSAFIRGACWFGPMRWRLA